MQRKDETAAWLRAVVPLVLTVFLAIVLVAVSVRYQRPADPLCRGLGAGFPAAFVCDASGESPPSSWGRIDWADTSSVNVLGSILDLLFYGLLLRGAVLLWGRLRQRGKPRARA